MTCLPATISELAELIGEPDALRLAEHYQGQRLYVPADPAPEHAISQLIGYAQAQRLAAHYGSQSLDIPMLHARKIDLRNRAIRNDSERMSYAELVRKWNLSRRQIANILNAEHHTPQNDLFEEHS